MKKLYYLLLAAALLPVGSKAQNLLNEDFEEYSADSSYYSTQFPTGWTVEKSSLPASTPRFKWSVEVYKGTYPSMSGHGWLYCDGAGYDGETKGGFGPREEKLITPALTLNNTYSLSFDWKAAAYAVLNSKAYTFQIRVIEGSDTTTIFDIQNEQDVRNSGVPKDPYGTYIWGNWAVNNSKIDLSAYQGKTIKIAFVYKMLAYSGANSLWVDNIKVQQSAAVTSPIAQSSLTSYTFQKMYIGEKHYTESFTIRNIGKGNLHITGFEAPDGVTLVGDTTKSAPATEKLSLQLAYKASLTSPTSGNIVIKTNGGDITIPFTATKEAVPDGYTLELFEKFPPAGWTNQGWGSTYQALEGDASAYAAGSFEDAYLISPRLDLSNASAPHKLIFTFYNSFDSEEGNTYATNDLSVWVSTDGGATWKDSVWTTVYNDPNQYNRLVTDTIDLSKYTSNNVKVRWKNPAVTYDVNSGAAEYSVFFLDRVLLPNVYGAEGKPISISYVAPANGATQIVPKNVTLEWKDAQFADSYKLYVGTSSSNFDIINGQNVGTVNKYTLATLPYASTIYWKVVGTNSLGDETDSPVWSFSTQADNSISTFPWFEGFEHGGTWPLGWYREDASQYSKWNLSDYYPYDGKYIATTSGRATDDVNRLYTPDVKLPADGQYQISFWWGNDVAVNLKKDANNVRTNKFSTTDNNADYGTFEIYADGQWKQLDRISDNSDDDNKYWIYESFDLSAYAGKTVQFRWSYDVTNYNNAYALSLDNVEIKSLAENSVAFNINSWFAGKVNADDTFKSDTVALTNLGGKDVTVSKVSFSTDNFTSTLPSNTTVKAGSSQQFVITFAAKQTAATDSVTVDDTLKVILTDGSVAALPVKGIALAKDIRFYGFEADKTGGVPAHFTGINADGTASVGVGTWSTPNLKEGAPLSFVVLNDAECYNSLKGAWGHQALMTRCNVDGAADDWLVSDQKYTITNRSTVQFDARPWESINSILPAGSPTFKVLVSETSATDRSTFTQVGSDKTPDLFNNVSWPHYSVDLSSYAGKTVYIAIEAVYTNSLGGFLDNVEFDHIGATTGINSITTDASALDVNAPMYNIAGQRVSKTYKGVVIQDGKKFIVK